MREIIKSCYEHHNLDPERYTYQDPEDSNADRSILLEKLRPHPPPTNSPAARLLPDPRCRLRSYKDETDESDDDGAPTKKGSMIHSAKSLLALA